MADLLFECYACGAIVPYAPGDDLCCPKCRSINVADDDAVDDVSLKSQEPRAKSPAEVLTPSEPAEELSALPDKAMSPARAVVPPAPPRLGLLFCVLLSVLCLVGCRAPNEAAAAQKLKNMKWHAPRTVQEETPAETRVREQYDGPAEVVPVEVAGDRTKERRGARQTAITPRR